MQEASIAQLQPWNWYAENAREIVDFIWRALVHVEETVQDGVVQSYTVGLFRVIIVPKDLPRDRITETPGTLFSDVVTREFKNGNDLKFNTLQIKNVGFFPMPQAVRVVQDKLLTK